MAFTLLAFVIRLWSVPHLGLVHFDEGIYCSAGLWIFSPHGLLDLPSSMIAYAPPGFPFLVGLFYYLLGVGDISAILVSILCGTLTIPAVSYLAHRTFGRGAGAAAAAFATLSGSHIAFSRMALTDSSFLLFWILALIAGQRFLEHPSLGRAVLLGLCVGLAQLFKYSGWLAGAIVVLTAVAYLLIDPAHWRTKRTYATWLWGLLAAMIAAAVYWPWYAFVESHGGYAGLLAHQRGYLSGIASWPGDLKLQLAQSRALSGGPFWLLSGGFAAGLALVFIADDTTSMRRILSRIVVQLLFLPALCLIPNLAWWVSLAGLPASLLRRRISEEGSRFFVCTGWLTLAAITPFYHPYARLWLPIEAFGWLFMGGLFADVSSRLDAVSSGVITLKGWKLVPFLSLSAFAAAALAVQAGVFGLSRNPRLPGLVAPTDSLRLASFTVARDLPADAKNLRVLARPPVTFYLGRATSVGLDTQPGLAGLLEQTGDGSWALLDTAIVRQDKDAEAELSRFSAAWVLVQSFPSRLSLPVLLDIEPASATASAVDARVELRLMRPKRAGDVP